MPDNALHMPKGAEKPEADAILARIRKKFAVELAPLEVDGAPIQTLSISNMQSHIDKLLASKAIRQPLRDLPLWAKIWPGSFVLGRFLRKFNPQGKTMLELGAGMGICSLIAARHGFAQITATDMESDALDFCRVNVLANGLENLVQVRHLDLKKPWQEEARFDVIAASELLYLDDLHRPLLKFIKRRLAPGGQAFFCTDIARDKPRFQKLAEKEFNVREGKIGVKSAGEDGEERRVYSILILENK